MKIYHEVEKEKAFRKKRGGFEHATCVRKFPQPNQSNVNKVRLWGGGEKTDTSDGNFTVSNLLFPKRATRVLKGRYQIESPIVDCAVGEIAIAIRIGAVEILTETGRRERKLLSLVLEETNYGESARNIEVRRGIAVSWVVNKTPSTPTSSYSGWSRSIVYGFDMARALKGLLDELTFGNMGSAIPGYVRNDTSEESHRVDSVNTMTD